MWPLKRKRNIVVNVDAFWIYFDPFNLSCLKVLISQQATSCSSGIQEPSDLRIYKQNLKCEIYKTNNLWCLNDTHLLPGVLLSHVAAHGISRQGRSGERISLKHLLGFLIKSQTTCWHICFFISPTWSTSFLLGDALIFCLFDTQNEFGWHLRISLFTIWLLCSSFLFQKSFWDAVPHWN